ncbi:MAG: 23S rRNA (uracil(1939)-C(5))-methyltransferase RlmD [Clostridia bacterium]|nr:23S rRNA (uracil(1939)-C(5))-methyltransferase RlmD [Clostridia bacterium]
MEIPIKKNEEYIVNIVDYGTNGEGIAKVDNFTIFINNALKGEKCKIHILKVLSSYAYGKVIEIIEPSDKRINPDCNMFYLCGGCDLRHVDYKETLRIKQEKVQNLVNKTLDKKIVVNKAIGMDNPLYYRNKAIFPVNNDKKIGFYKKRTHDIIELDIEKEYCKIHSSKSQEIAQFTLDIFEGDIYNSKTKSGVLRNIMIREGFKTGEFMLVLVQTTNEVLIDVDKIIKKYPQIKTIIINKNSKNTNVILSRDNKVVYGKGYISDKLGDYFFKISPNSFYQVNPVQTERIYNFAIEKAELKKTDILCDLYCGIGTIGIFASKYVNKVYGIEIVPEAITDAKQNAQDNNIHNIEFIEGDVEKAFNDFINKDVKPNVVIVDPPRKGLDAKTVQSLNNLKLEKLVYISCNPATMVRDLKELKETYKIKEIQPVDNFCYTSHVETIAILEKVI